MIVIIVMSDRGSAQIWGDSINIAIGEKLLPLLWLRSLRLHWRRAEPETQWRPVLGLRQKYAPLRKKLGVTH